MAKKITQIEINGETYNVGGSGESVSGNFINQVDDFSQYVPTKWNEIAQYVGTDTPLYKNGYFYKNSGSWIISADSLQIAYQSISEGSEHVIPIVSPLYEGLSNLIFVGSTAYYGMRWGNTPTVGGKIFDFLTGTINTITAVTDNGDETYTCVTDGGAREETTTYTLDMTEEFDYNARVDAYKNRFIVIGHTDISDYPSSMFGFYIVEETDPNTGTLVENYYPARLNGCVASYTTAPVVLDSGTWTQIDVQPTSSNALVGYILANNKVSIVPLVDCYIENGNLYDPTTHEQLYPTSDTYYYEINEEKVYTPDESYELVDVTSSVLIQPSVNQIVIEIRGNEAFRWNGLSYNQIVDSTKAPDVATFSEAQTRENIKGDGTENTATLWGKVKKWFSDLKDLAFIAIDGVNSTKFLRGDGTWATPTDTNTWRPLGTGASDACAGNDSRLSNPRPASDVYAWAKASTKPSYTASEVGAMSSATESKTSTTWYNNLRGQFSCYKIGRIVIGYIGISSKTTQIDGGIAICLLPYTPSQDIYFPVQNADTANGLLKISSGSTILKTSTFLSAGTSFYGMFCYVATS